MVTRERVLLAPRTRILSVRIPMLKHLEKRVHRGGRFKLGGHNSLRRTSVSQAHSCPETSKQCFKDGGELDNVKFNEAMLPMIKTIDGFLASQRKPRKVTPKGLYVNDMMETSKISKAFPPND